jgi:hypothetical protein
MAKPECKEIRTAPSVGNFLKIEFILPAGVDLESMTSDVLESFQSNI